MSISGEVHSTGPKQEDYNFTFRLGGREFIINEQITIKELDEAIIAINAALSKEKNLMAVKQRIYQFMLQHHSFDGYIADFLAKEKRQ